MNGAVNQKRLKNTDLAFLKITALRAVVLNQGAVKN
jgi:hypothetical protein